MTLKLWLKRHKTNQAGKAPISLRITIAGQRAEVSTELRVRPDQWDQTTETILGKGRATDLDNEHLEELKADARRHRRELPATERTAAAVAARLRGEAVAPPVCLLVAGEAVLASHYRTARQSSVGVFERAFALLREWHGGAGMLPPAALSPGRRQAFVDWLALRVSPGTVRSYLISLSALLRRTGALPDGHPAFAGLKLPKRRAVVRASLSRAQLEQLGGGPLPRAQHDARNLYLACFYLHGSRISAVLEIRWADVAAGRVRYQAMKGGPLKQVQVTPELLGLLAQYRPAGEPAPAGLVFPYLPAGYFDLSEKDRYEARHRAISAVNYHLRRGCEALGLPGNIHPHTARHTMARVTVEATGDIRAAQHILGHTTYQQTEAYVRGMLLGEIDDAAERAYAAMRRA